MYVIKTQGNLWAVWRVVSPYWAEADMVAASELPIDTSATALEMAQEIFGDGVTVTGASFSGDNDSSGIYTGGDAIAPGVTPGDTGVVLSTGDAEDFINSSGQANQSTQTSTNTSGVNNNNQLNTAAGTSTRDAAILDIDFITTGDFMTKDWSFVVPMLNTYSGKRPSWFQPDISLTVLQRGTNHRVQL